MTENGKAAEAEQYQLFMSSLTDALSHGKPMEKYFGPKGFKRFVLGALQVYAGDIEKKHGLRITLTNDGLEVLIQDRNLHLKAKGMAQKKLGVFWTPPHPFNIDATAKNSIDKKDRITVNPVKVNPAKLFVYDVQGMVEGEIKGWGLYRLLKRNLAETLAARNLEETSFWTRITKSNLVYVYVEGRPIKPTAK